MRPFLTAWGLFPDHGLNGSYVSFLFIATFGLCQSPESLCWKTAMAQSEMNRCADLDARQADADLNRVYRELLPILLSRPCLFVLTVVNY